MAKKIKAKDAKPGRFYIIKDTLHMFLGWDGNIYDFQEVGSSVRHGCGPHDKVKPVNVFMFSK